MRRSEWIYTGPRLRSPSRFVTPHLILNLSVSRLAGVDQAIHKMTVGHYTLDVKVSQLIDRLSTMDGKTTGSSSLLRLSHTSTTGKLPLNESDSQKQGWATILPKGPH